MLLTEFFDETPMGYDDGAKTSDGSTPTPTDTRKTKITLAQLHRLRVLNDVRRFEQMQKVTSIQQQYTPPVEAGGGMM